MRISSALVSFFLGFVVHASALLRHLRPVNNPPALLKARPADPPWLRQMKQYAGQSCMTGAPVTSWILECFRHTNFGIPKVIPSACAAALNRCLEECGIKGTGSAAAASFLDWGVPLSELRPGAICIFRWANGEHHVTLCESVFEEHTVICFGANQGHKVQQAAYSDRWLQAIKWPAGVAK